jgi:hypothetical protein
VSHVGLGSSNAVDEPATDGALGVLKTSCVYDGYFNPEGGYAHLRGW